MILILTQDLMMSSSVNAAAKSKGLTAKSVTSIEKAVELLKQESVSLFLVDLQMPGVNVDAIDKKLTENDCQSIPTIAYAQHVNVDMILKARDRSFDQVMTRGQLAANLPQLIQ
jgi:DNA-binding NtrC family response regulator